MTFDSLWEALLQVGRDPSTDGYRRFAWTVADLQCRAWFRAAAEERGLALETDRNGNLWAWWGNPSGGDAVVVGSHLDSVPDGGAYDGPLGVVSAFAAIDELRSRNLTPTRPIAVVAFVDEEGARFGVACVGSRLLTGVLTAERALTLRDADGTMADAMEAAGHDPASVGPDRKQLSGIGCFVELHIEQGRALADLDAPVGVCDGIWPHGRWRFDFFGQADHAGTTRLVDRADPMLEYAGTVIAAREAAERRNLLATFGKMRVEPNAVNAIPSRVTAWLDARGPDEAQVRALVAELSGSRWLRLDVVEESWTPAITFDAELREQVSALLGGVPVLPTGAGHDAGILQAAGVPSAMLFVRNPTGVSHSPAEHAERADCLAGVAALVGVIEEMAR